MEALNPDNRATAIQLVAADMAEIHLCGLDEIPLTDYKRRRTLTDQAKARAYLFVDEAQDIVDGITGMIRDEVIDEATKHS